MNNILNTVYLFILGIVAIYTQEIVTFVMLGVILIALNNINKTLKEILMVQKQNKNEQE
ncbi:hypothetical protein [Bacillus marasmi]|uniref:hypothetical protein n=1 Tax=Bacillus marasmi TaxID=1926279 RepID=UPI00164E560C|nr:hypothetical protein [Bacillus marasmi]